MRKTLSMKALFQKILMAVVSFTILNVWLFRFSKSTIYRGGDAVDMISEFAAYGLSTSVLYMVGAIKVLSAVLLLIGFGYSKLVKPASYVISVMMLAAIYFHYSIADQWLKSLPAALMLLSSLLIIYLDRRMSTMVNY